MQFKNRDSEWEKHLKNIRDRRRVQSAIVIVGFVVICALVIMCVSALIPNRSVPPDGETETISPEKTTSSPGTTAAPGTTASPETTATPPTTQTPKQTTEPALTTSAPATTEPKQTTAAPETSTAPAEYDYRININKYLQYIEPSNADAYLLLVNTKSTLGQSYEPSDLTDLPSTRKDGRQTQQMRLYAAKALEAMLSEAATYGYTQYSVTSAYRSYSYQNQLFSSYCTQEKAEHPSWSNAQIEAFVLTYSTKPGTSEHQSGLACDLLYGSYYAADFDNGEAGTPKKNKYATEIDDVAWLIENCYKFGFVLRFEESKKELTGIIYEPWHFRFVGRYHATQMKELDMCLEEYTAWLDGNR